MIIVVGGIKGGSGKTTIATNLAVLRSEFNKVLLVDADEQKSTTDWVNQREGMGIPTKWSTIQLAGKMIYSQLLRMKADYDDIIIDTGARDTTSQRSALSIADKFLSPFKPRSFDIWTIGAFNLLINEIHTVNPNLKCYAVINQADSTGNDNNEAVEILKECSSLTCLPTFICNRKSFGNAATQGMGVCELKIQDKKAIQEITELYNHIF
jgi:chromosome partitioning protein